MDPVTSAQRAREGLARGLALLQSPGLPPSLSPVVEQVAQVMTLLHRIESTRGAAFVEAAPTALGITRRALGELQALNLPQLEVERALEVIAGSLGTIHQLAQAAIGSQSTQASAQMPQAPAPARPAPGVSPYAGTMLESHGNAPGRPNTPLIAPPNHAPGHHHAPPPPAVSRQVPPPPQAAPYPQPGVAPQYATQPSAAYPPQHAAPPYAAPAAAPHPAPQPPYPPSPATPYGAPPVSGWQQPQPGYQQQPQPGYQQQPGWQQPQPAPSQPQQPAWHPPPAAAVSPQSAPVAPHPPAQDWERPPASALQRPPANVGPGAPVRVEAALGAHSPTNFYKGLAGNDVIDAGGLFVATYQIPPIGTQVMLKVALPGGYEFEAIGRRALGARNARCRVGRAARLRCADSSRSLPKLGISSIATFAIASRSSTTTTDVGMARLVRGRPAFSTRRRLGAAGVCPPASSR